MALFLNFYRLLIRLLPRSFREEFGAEMEAIVEERLAEASAQGRGAFLHTCLQELRDWPGYCLQLHWEARQARLALGPEQGITPWGSFLAALPHLLLAFLVGGGSLVLLWVGAASQDAANLFALAAGLLLVLMLLVAWWRGWPAWSVPWIGYLFFVLFVLVLPSGLYSWWQAAPSGRQIVQRLLSEVGVPLLWLAALYLVLQRWPRAGIVAMLPALGMAWFLYLEFVPGLLVFLIQAATWGWLGIITAVMLGRQQQGRNVWLLYLSAVLVGAVFVLAGHYLTEPQVRDRTLARMAGDLFSNLLPVLTPLVAIILLHSLRLWLRESGADRRGSYSLIVAGTLLGVVGAQIAVRSLLWMGEPAAVAAQIGIAFVLIGAAGPALVVLAAVQLWRSRRQWAVPGGRAIWLLVGLLVLVPAIYDVRTLQNVYDGLAYGGPNSRAIIALQSWRWLVTQASYGLGIGWLLLAAWVIGRAPSQTPLAAPLDAAGLTSAPPDRRPGRRWPFLRGIGYFLAILVLALLLLPASWLLPLVPDPRLVTERFNANTGLVLCARSALTLIMSTVLLYPALTNAQTGRGQPERRNGRPSVLLNIAVCGLLLVKALHSLYWLLIWDSTYDPIDVLWLVLVVFAVLAAGALLAVALPWRRKLRGALLTLVLLALVATVFALSQRVDFRHLTAARAQRVAQALDRYYERHGRYPEALQQLTPWTTLSVAEPVVVYGESWCYEGSDNYYRLGYIDRAHWSNPNFVGRIAHMGGSAPNSSSLCAGEAAALLDRYGDYYSYTDVTDERQ